MTTSKMNLLATAVALSAISFGSLSHAGVTVSVIPAYGPDFSQSASATGYYSNAIAALRGMSVANRDDDPTGYEVVPAGPIPTTEAMVSEMFNSWRGMADPTPGWPDGTMTPNVFASEFGNAVYFGLRAVVDDPVADGISLSGLAGEIHWEDVGSGPSTIFTQTLSFMPGDLTAYSTRRVGVEFGADNMPGGGDDTVYTSGPSSQKVDALYLVGLADAIFVSRSMPPMQTEQQDLTEVALKLEGPGSPQQKLTASYSIGTMMMPNPVIGTGEVIFVPEPTSGLSAAIFMIFAAFQRRRFGL